MAEVKKVVTTKKPVTKVAAPKVVAKVALKPAPTSLRATAKQSPSSKLGKNEIAASPSAPRNDASRLAESRNDGNVVRKSGSLSVPVYSLAGKTAGSMELPKEIFGASVNSGLLAQAVRVYLNNQKAHHSNTQTRAEVTASTRKIYKQKGTGRARHGALSAPVFVGGGKAMGAKYRKTILDLPKKMKKAALVAALSEKASENAVFGITGIDKATGKTKEMASFVSSIKKQVLTEEKKTNKNKKVSALLVLEDNLDKARRAARNIPGFNFATVDQINVFEVIKHQNLIITKDAAAKLSERLTKKESK